MSRTNKRGEIRELQDQLSSNQMQQKKTAIRKIIDAMTRGKDVSMLFMDIIKNLETSDMELKKLIYLYIINYAKSQPDKAILAINSFRKDAMDKQNPFLRALAVRTMGYIRVKQIVEYLMDTLRKSMKDEDSYVRKTAALTVAKLYDVNPQIIEEQGFIEQLQEMLKDGNSMVVSNTVAALQSISNSKGSAVFKVKHDVIKKLLTALNECTEWAQIYLMDQFSEYTPHDNNECEQILERIVPRIQHQNAGVLLSATKVILKYLDYLNDPELIRQYCRQITAPLISLMNNENEIVYVALKNMQIICQKRPIILEKEIKPFFCKFNDPIYVKLEKLELMVLLASSDNYQQILNELKEYVNEVDVEFVKKSIRAISRIGIKNEKAANQSVATLQDCLKTRVNYVVQEVIVVIKDIFRKYPFRYEALLPELCENLKSLDDPTAKSSMIYIIGDYLETIENADQLLSIFVDGFQDDDSMVQMQILISVMKLLIIRPDEGYPLFMHLCQFIQNSSENVELRERMLIYQRLLQYFPEKVKGILIQEDKPILNEQSFAMDPALLDRLVENIGSLASVYQKQPESFVKRLRDIQNQLKILRDEEKNEEEPEELLQNQEYNDADIQSNNGNTQQSQSQQQPQQQQQQQQQTEQSMNLLDDDLLGDDTNQQQQQEQQQPQEWNYKNIRIPNFTILQRTQQSVNQQISGVEIQGSIQLENQQIVLHLEIMNHTQQCLSEFALKINKNTFKLSPKEQMKISQINPSQSSYQRIELDLNNQSDNQPPSFPLNIQMAMKTNLDIFMFYIPVSLSVLFQTNPQQISAQSYLQYQQQFQGKKVEMMTLKKQELIVNPMMLKQQLIDNNMYLIGTRTNPQGVQMNSYYAVTVNNMPLLVDVIQQNEQVQLSLAVPHLSLVPLFQQALSFILNL